MNSEKSTWYREPHDPSLLRAEPTRGSAGSLGRLAGFGLVSVLVSAILLSVGIVCLGDFDQGMLCLLATSALGVTALPVFFLRRLELYEPTWFVLVIVAIGVTGKAFYLIFGPADRVDFLLLDKASGDLQFAALIMALSLLGFSFGYLQGGWRWRLPMIPWLMRREWNGRRLILVSGAMICLGLASFGLFVWRLDIHFESLRDFSAPRFQSIPGATHRGSLGYFRWGAMFTELGFYLAFTHWVSQRRRLVSLSGALIFSLGLLALAFPVFASTRNVVLLMLIRCVVIWILLRGTPKIRYLITLAVAGLILVGSMLALRLGASDWQELRSEVNVGQILEFTVGSRHFLDLTKTAHILDAVPGEIEFRYGETFLTWIVAPIPRSLWPEKPAIGAGKDLGPTVFGTLPATGVPPGIIAELYLNLGFPGVFIGLIVLGLFLRTLYESFRPYLSIPSMALLYALFSTRLTLDLMAGQISGSIAKLLQETIPLMIALAYCARRVNAPRASTVSDVPSAGVEPDGSARRAPV